MMVQLEFDFTPKKLAAPETPAEPRVKPRTLFPIIQPEDKNRWRRVWPPEPVAARSETLDVRLEEDSFADELFALGTFPKDAEAPATRPRSRSQCAAGPRPCPWVSCRYHLFLDVRADGSLKLNFPEKEPDELTVSCSLDLAEDGPRTLDSIAAIMGMSKERARQLESAAFDKLYTTLPRAYGADMSIEDEWV